MLPRSLGLISSNTSANNTIKYLERKAKKFLKIEARRNGRYEKKKVKRERKCVTYGNGVNRIRCLEGKVYVANRIAIDSHLKFQQCITREHRVSIVYRTLQPSDPRQSNRIVKVTKKYIPFLNGYQNGITTCSIERSDFLKNPRG